MNLSEENKENSANEFSHRLSEKLRNGLISIDEMMVAIDHFLMLVKTDEEITLRRFVESV